MFLDSDFMVDNGFQRLTVLELNFASHDGSRRRSKRALPPDIGVMAKTALQFDPKGRSLEVQKYESEFRSLTANGTRLPKGEKLNDSFTIKGKILTKVNRVINAVPVRGEKAGYKYCLTGEAVQRNVPLVNFIWL